MVNRRYYQRVSWLIMSCLFVGCNVVGNEDPWYEGISGKYNLASVAGIELADSVKVFSGSAVDYCGFGCYYDQYVLSAKLEVDDIDGISLETEYSLNYYRDQSPPPKVYERFSEEVRYVYLHRWENMKKNKINVRTEYFSGAPTTFWVQPNGDLKETYLGLEWTYSRVK